MHKTTWVALLRAVNVGGRTVKMDALRASFARLDPDLGVENVWTFIASGNVVFDAAGRPSLQREARLRHAIEDTLREAFGFEVTTFLRTREELLAVAQKTVPAELAGNTKHAFYVSFLAEAPEPAAAGRLAALATGGDRLWVEGRELYWYRSDRTVEMGLGGPALEKALAQPSTQRNITSVQKLAAKLSAAI